MAPVDHMDASMSNQVLAPWGSWAAPIVIPDDDDSHRVIQRPFGVAGTQPYQNPVNFRPSIATTPTFASSSSLEYPSNGHRHMMSMGYQPGSGLGRRNDGIVEPVQLPLKRKMGDSGIGSSGGPDTQKPRPGPSSHPQPQTNGMQPIPIPSESKKARKKRRRMEQAQKQVVPPSAIERPPQGQPYLRNLSVIPPIPHNWRSPAEILGWQASHAPISGDPSYDTREFGFGASSLAPVERMAPSSASFSSSQTSPVPNRQTGDASGPSLSFQQTPATHSRQTTGPADPLARVMDISGKQTVPSRNELNQEVTKLYKATPSLQRTPVLYLPPYARHDKYFQPLAPIGLSLKSTSDPEKGYYTTSTPSRRATLVALSRSLVMHFIPKKCRNVEFLRFWLKGFGEPTPTYVSLNPKEGRALIEFASEEQAVRAFNSPRYNNTCGIGSIRLCWYRREMEEGEIEEDISSKPVDSPPPLTKKQLKASKRLQAEKEAEEALERKKLAEIQYLEERLAQERARPRTGHDTESSSASQARAQVHILQQSGDASNGDGPDWPGDVSRGARPRASSITSSRGSIRFTPTDQSTSDYDETILLVSPNGPDHDHTTPSIPETKSQFSTSVSLAEPQVDRMSSRSFSGTPSLEPAPIEPRATMNVSEEPKSPLVPRTSGMNSGSSFNTSQVTPLQPSAPQRQSTNVGPVIPIAPQAAARQEMLRKLVLESKKRRPDEPVTQQAEVSLVLPDDSLLPVGVSTLVNGLKHALPPKPDMDDIAVSFITEAICSVTPDNSKPTKPAQSSASTVLEAKQKRLEQHISESKMLMSQFAAATTKQEKDQILALLREKNRLLNTEPSSPTSSPSHAKPPNQHAYQNSGRYRWPTIHHCVLILSDDEEEDEEEL